MQLQQEEAEETDEHHKIFVEQVEDEYYVQIEHDMTKRHYISFEEEDYVITIENVYCFPQCFAAVADRIGNMHGRYVVADIGSWTKDIICIDERKVQPDKCVTVPNSIITLFQEINAAVAEATGGRIPESVVQNFILGSNEKFGLFVTELRKEKNLTQKDLAEKLYVSDKTVSKWERGLSMPNVVLLIPIADILDVTVTELLRGEKIDTQKNIDTKEVEELVVGSLDMAVRDSIHQHRKNWILAYLLCLFISITEIIILVVSGSSLAEMKGDILLVTGVMLLFGAWFCFLAKDILPTYYDANKINYVSQGIFRIHLVGLSFNNGNWIYICTTLKIWTLATVVLYPLAGIIIINCFNIALWDILNNIFLIMILGGMVVSIYIIGKKYE